YDKPTTRLEDALEKLTRDVLPSLKKAEKRFGSNAEVALFLWDALHKRPLANPHAGYASHSAISTHNACW
ncbi:MAG: hypothetical protein ACK2UU_04140, partial [Anaerolineae bacterium]